MMAHEWPYHGGAETTAWAVLELYAPRPKTQLLQRGDSSKRREELGTSRTLLRLAEAGTGGSHQRRYEDEKQSND